MKMLMKGALALVLCSVVQIQAKAEAPKSVKSPFTSGPSMVIPRGDYPVVLTNNTDNTLSRVKVYFKVKGKINDQTQIISGVTSVEGVLPGRTVTVTGKNAVDKNGANVFSKFNKITNAHVSSIKVGKTSRYVPSKDIYANRFIVTIRTSLKGTIAPYLIESEEDYQTRVTKAEKRQAAKEAAKNK